jgi:hypothetical protein
MMTLLRDIQEAATGTDVPVATLLRKAQILAARLDHAPLREWASQELDGYRDFESLPDYRRLGRVTVVGDFSGPFGSSMRNAMIPESNVPDEWRETLFTHNVYESVAELEAILARRDEGLLYPWPADVTASLADHFYEGMGAMRIAKSLAPSAIAGVLDTIRNRLLAFALDIERLDARAGDVAPGEPPPVAPAAVTQVFNTTIHGGQVSLAAAGQGDVAQSVSQTGEAPRSITDVAGTLREWGLPDEDIRELEEALAADRDAAGGELVVGQQTQNWLGRVATRISAGAVTVAENVTVETIVGLLTKLAGA